MDPEIFQYFFLTLVIELPVIILFYPDKWKMALLVGFLVNAFTWPLLQVVLLRVDRDWLTPLEVIITFIEATGLYLFLGKKWTRALLAGFIANGLSYGIGFFLN